jgi:hypothetical protein
VDCEWDSSKAAANFRKHGVTFEEAVTALSDDLSITALIPITRWASAASSRSASRAADDCLLWPTRNEVRVCASSVLDLRAEMSVEFMKKVKANAVDELRAAYKREDFGPMVRGKYAARLKASSNVVVLRPEVAKAFPNADAVYDALMGLINLAKTSTRMGPRSTRARTKPDIG